MIFIITYFFFVSANNAVSLQRKKILLFIGILILSIFSCMRNIEVGTDTAYTIELYFEGAKKYNSIKELLFSGISNSTLIFLVISKLLMLLGLGAKSFLFATQMLVLAPVAAVAYARREKTSISLTMMVFVLLYFQLSFNWIRQSISTAFLLLGITLFLENRKKSSIIVAIISVIFHASALLGILMFAVAWFSSKSKNKNFRRVLILVTIILTFVIMRSWKPLALWMINKGILPVSYMGYVNVFSGAYGGIYKGWFVIGQKTYVEYILRLAMFIIPGYVLKSKADYSDGNNQIQEMNLFRMCSMLSFFIYSAALWGLHTAYGNRITYYLDFANIIYLGLCCRPRYDRKKLSITYTEATIFILILTYNIWLYYVLGWHATVPFYL